MQKSVNWKVHTPNLLQEILNNPGTGILTQPLRILASILSDVGERAAELNDPKLNALMCRLTIYSISDPTAPDYDPEAVREILKQAASVGGEE